MTDALISRGDAIAILEDEMPGHYLSKKTQIVAKLRAMPAYEVAARELEWVDQSITKIDRAICAIGVYYIQHNRGGEFFWWLGGKGAEKAIAKSIPAAKAAAQADYAARIRSALTATPAADVAGLVDWIDKNSARLGQVQGFAYGEDGLLFTVRDCWPKENQTVWQKQSSAESQRADHADMIRQIDIYRMSLAFAALARMKETKA